MIIIERQLILGVKEPTIIQNIIIVRQLILGVKEPTLIQNDHYCEAANPWSERAYPYSE